MALTACSNCGSTSFSGSVLVSFYDVRIEIDPEEDGGFRSAYWADAHADSDQVIYARCDQCGTEVFDPEKE